jgi:hypothetical protein
MHYLGMEKFAAAANEVLNWVPNNIEASLAIGAVFTAVATIAYLRLRDHFARPTPTAFDDPKIRASRARSRELFKRLGIRHSEP